MQSNILKPQNEFSLFFVVEVNKNHLSVLSSVSNLETEREKLAKKHNSDITATVSFGYDIWQDWISKHLSLATPSGFFPFKKLVSPNLSKTGKKFHYAPATGGDIFIHVNSERMDLNYQLVSSVLFNFKKDIKVLVDTSGYKYLGGRDLTGFLDGTMNPSTLKEKTETAIIQSKDLTHEKNEDVKKVMENGSFVLVQKWEHQLTKWEAETETEQEKVIGRKKPDSKALLPRPPTSHVARSILRENGKQYKILRASFPYGNKTNVAGLLFCSYAKDLNVIDKMLKKMYGLRDQDKEGTVLYDRTLDFSQAVTGAYFFTPSLQVLEEIGKRAAENGKINSKL